MHIFILELDILAYNRNINAIIENIITILYFNYMLLPINSSKKCDKYLWFLAGIEGLENLKKFLSLR